MVPNSLIKLNLDVGYIVIMQINKGPHYVLATGYTGNTISVNDPLYPATKAYDISTVVAGKTAIYKVPVTLLQEWSKLLIWDNYLSTAIKLWEIFHFFE